MKEKEYLIAFQYQPRLYEWKWGRIIKFCKMTGANLKNIEDEIRDTLKVIDVRIITFSELESDSEGV